MDTIRLIAAICFVIGNIVMGAAFIYFGLSFVTNLKYASEIQTGALLFYLASFFIVQILPK